MLHSITIIFLTLLALTFADLGGFRSISDQSSERDLQTFQTCNTEFPGVYLCGVDKSYVYHKGKKLCIGDADTPSHREHGDSCGCGPSPCPAPVAPCSAVADNTDCTYIDDLGVTQNGKLLCHNFVNNPVAICISDSDTLAHQAAHGAKLGDFCITATKLCVKPTCSDAVKPKKCSCSSNSDCLSGKCKNKNGVSTCN